MVGLLWEQEVGRSNQPEADKSGRPDQPSLLNGVENEGCRAEA
jgi:hypothetical protein